MLSIGQAIAALILSFYLPMGSYDEIITPHLIPCLLNILQYSYTIIYLQIYVQYLSG